MRIALLELRRQPSRFGTATLILTLIAVLLMFLGGLLDGLIRNSTGAVESIRGDAIVFSESSQASFLRSRVDDAQRAQLQADLHGAEIGGLGVSLLGVRVPGNGPRDLANVAVWGYESAIDGVPEPPPTGTAWADRSLRNDGVELGHQLEIGPARTPVVVAGWVGSSAYNGQASLWADVETWRDVLNQNRPDAALAEGVTQALVVSIAGPDSGDAAAIVDAALDDELIALTVAETIDAIPGVTEQQQTFNQILGVTVVIALVVTALFFALLTVERAGLYAVFKAVGARTRTLFAGLVVQAVAVTLIAATAAATAVVLIDAALPPGSIPLLVTFERIVTSVVLLLVAAIAGCAFSLRRIVKIDPATALGGS